MDNLSQVFRNLSKWSQLPNYQLERRIDIFFSIYLKELIKDAIGESVEELILPEFPINKVNVCENIRKNESYKVDYLAFCKGSNTIYFIELKTNMQSRRTKQDKYLEKSLRLGFEGVMSGLKEIFIATESWLKYFQLFTYLADLTLINLPDDFKKEKVQNKNFRKVLVEKIVVKKVKMKIIYIQPIKSEFCSKDIISIDFKSLLEVLSRYSDAISCEFREFLDSTYQISKKG